MISENDPAGMGIAFSNAINRYTGHHCRLVTTKTRYNFEFEKDLHIPDLDADGFDEVNDVLRQSDIVHFHILADENMHLGPMHLKDYVDGKTILHHHHGHPDFRSHPEKFREKYQRLRRKVVVSTPDLLKLVPEASWLPNLVPLDNPLFVPKSCKANGTVIIGQAPTRKELKNTEQLLSVAKSLQLQNTTPPFQLKIIERLSHKKCLEEKNRCHIVFDHMQGYYGVSSLESLSQGKPVIAGLDPWNEYHIKNFTGCDVLPWVLAHNRDELQVCLKDLLLKAELRDRIGKQSRAFMEGHWSEEQVLKFLFEVYETA